MGDLDEWRSFRATGTAIQEQAVPPRISVVIVTRDRLDPLRACLASIAQQQAPPSFEVVVVDDGSRESIADRIEVAGRLFPLRIERQVPLGIAAARNLGAELARAELILYVDSDCELEPEALRELDSYARMYPQEAAFQLRLVGGDDCATNRLEGLRLAAILERTRTENGQVHYANTSGFALRRAFANGQRLFDPAFVRGEDTELLSRLGSGGHWPVLVESGVVSHHPSFPLGRYVRKHYAIGYWAGAARAEFGAARHRFLGPRERLVVLRSLMRSAAKRGTSARILALICVCYSLETLGRVAHAVFGMHPGRRQVLACAVDPVRERELLARIIGAARRREAIAVTYLTSWTLVAAHRAPKFARLLESFDLVYPDGMGVVLALGLTRGERSKKVTAADFFFELCRESAQRGCRVALIGAEPGVVDHLTARLQGEAPGLDVVCARHGYLSHEERGELAAQLRDLDPHLVVLGMGQPHQEELAIELRDTLHGAVWCVGGLFDLLSGDRPQPPWWVRRLGFEWAHRLVTRPRAMWVRYVIGLPYLFWLLVRDLGTRAFSCVTRPFHPSSSSG